MAGHRPHFAPVSTSDSQTPPDPPVADPPVTDPPVTDPPVPPQATRALVILLLIAGILAGAQLGKIAQIVPWYRDVLGLSLVQVGWVVSLLGIFGALLSVVAGALSTRLGTGRVVLAGAAIIVLGGTWLAVETVFPRILMARGLEALGYLVFVVAAPTLLSQVTPLRWRGSVLALWGGFVPVGFAVAALIAAILTPLLSAQAFLLIMTALFAVASLAAARNLPRALRVPSVDRTRTPFSLRLPAGVWLVAAAFGTYVILSIGFFTFLPTLFAERGITAASIAGFIALTVPVGTITASTALRAGTGPWPPAVAGLIIIGVSAVFYYPAQDHTFLVGLAVLYAIANGLVGSALFAAIPMVSPDAHSRAQAFGVFAQAGGIGLVVSPPAAGFLIETVGWVGVGIASAALAAVSLGLVAGARRTAATSALCAQAT